MRKAEAVAPVVTIAIVAVVVAAVVDEAAIAEAVVVVEMAAAEAAVVTEEEALLEETADAVASGSVREKQAGLFRQKGVNSEVRINVVSPHHAKAEVALAADRKAL